MTVSGNEAALVGADRINDALVAFTGCIGNAMLDICSYGLTIGETYVPFDPDNDDGCDAEDVACSQVWVRVMGISPIMSDSFETADTAAVMRLTIEVGVLRCLDIPEEGSAPTATEVLVASMQAMSDMHAIFCAAMSCEVWNSIDSGDWNPMGPLGGQYGGSWTFTTEL